MSPAEEDEVSSTEAARILGATRPTVHAIPRDRLPYRETPGSALRRGRRFYRRADVERLARELRGDA